MLADYSDAVVCVPTVDIHSLPQYLGNMTVPEHIKIAALLPTTKCVVEDFQFHETVRRNRDYDCRIFTGRELPLKWLDEGRLSSVPSASTLSIPLSMFAFCDGGG